MSTIVEASPGATHLATTSPTAPPDDNSPKGQRRVASLDVLRGLAIIGTLATNIGIWAQVTGSTNAFWQHVDTGIGLLTDGKYIGLLTIMFGIGLEIQRQSAIRKGEPWLGAYPWRAALLILDGLLNYIFIFDFDVLMGYGLTGLTMCFVFATTERFQKWFLAFGIAVHLAMLSWMARVWTWFSPSSQGNLGASTLTKADIALLEKSPAELSHPELARVAKIYQVPTDEYARVWNEQKAQMANFEPSGYWDTVSGRFENFWQGRSEIPIMFTMGLGMFLVGAFLYRKGVFEPAARKLRFWVMAASFSIALPIDWLTRIYLAEYAHPFNRYFTSAAVSLGILALVAHFYAKGRQPGIIGKPLSLVGKMALTCYLMQNLLALILFADYGPLNLERFWPKTWPSTLGVYSGWALISAILIGFSWLWLKRFSRGPVELVWHKSYDWVTTHVPTRWEPRVKRLDADRAGPRLDRDRVFALEGSE